MPKLFRHSPKQQVILTSEALKQVERDFGLKTIRFEICS